MLQAGVRECKMIGLSDLSPSATAELPPERSSAILSVAVKKEQGGWTYRAGPSDPNLVQSPYYCFTDPIF